VYLGVLIDAEIVFRDIREFDEIREEGSDKAS
jgi:hypothetical protein